MGGANTALLRWVGAARCVQVPPAVVWVETRGTHGDLLHQTVAVGMAELRRVLEEADQELPAFVWKELERYLGCGDPQNGFAWLVCERCDGHRLVPFSCKGRAFCPCCCGRRMAERAARWCETHFAEVPHRQWVLTVAWPRRRLLAWRPELARGVLDLALREVFAWLVAHAEERHEVVDARTGAVTVEQRFGSSLALNLHFHCLLPDGVWARDEAGALRFHRVRPTPEALETLVRRIAEASERWLVGQGVDDEEAPDDAQAVLFAASVANQVAAGPRTGQPVRRYRAVPPRFEEVSRSGDGVLCEGYGLHAGTWVPASDRVGLEQLARYLLRPPLAKARLEGRPDGQVVLHLRKPWRDGTAAFLFTPLELTEKLAALVVRPRVHTTHFHGVYAAHAAWRSELVPRRLPDAGRDGKTTLLRRPAPLKGRNRSAWCPWSELLERVFGTGGFVCPRCAGQMTLRTVVVGPPATTRILAGLANSSRGPPSVARIA